MEMLLYIAAIIAAVAFLVLCISLAVTLFSAKNILNNIAETVSGLHIHLQNVTKETAELLHKTNTLAEDLQEKSEKLNSVVDAVKDVGVTIKGLNTSLQKVTSTISDEMEKNDGKMAQAVKWGSVILDFRNKWKDK